MIETLIGTTILAIDAQERSLRALKDLARRLCADERGATAIEYGLIGTGIGVAIVGIVFTLGNDISAFFSAVGSKLQSIKPT